MKKFAILTFAVVSLALGFVSCKKDGTGSGSMTLKVDGTSWSASLAVVAVNTNGILSVTGSDSGARQCAFTLTSVTGPGTYTLGVTMDNSNSGRWTAGLLPKDTYNTMLAQGSGTCTITELTESGVMGTFEFTAKNTSGTMVTITEGSFSANF